MFLTLPDAVSTDLVRDVLNALGSAEFVDGRETAAKNAARIKRNLQLSEGSVALRKELSGKLTASLMRNQMFTQGALPRTMTDFLFSRYEPGMEYGIHLDDAIMSMGTDRPLRSDLSMTLFLSHPSEYDGGELVINSGSSTLAFKLEPGSAIVYPTTELHHVAPVTRGVRRVAVCWIQSLVRRTAQREILTDLFLAISHVHRMQAPEELENNQSFPLLSKARLNLIRMWAEM